MSAREKIENLTNSWYGFALFGGLFSFLQGGFGLFSALGAMGSTLLSLFLTYFFGRRLLAKGSITRLFLIVVSAIGLAAWSYGAYGIGRAFINAWSFKLLFGLVYAAASVHMNFKSLRVLTDSQVKSYVG